MLMLFILFGLISCFGYRVNPVIYRPRSIPQLFRYIPVNIKYHRATIKQNVTYDDLALKKCKNDNTYSIHGWWPEYREGSWPQWCNKTEFKNFTQSSIKSIINDMNKYWYACPEWNMKNFDLWTHELNKHGSCITDETILNYFSKTLIAYQNAINNNWFECCSDNKDPTQCLIPFSRNINETKWLGYCH